MTTNMHYGCCILAIVYSLLQYYCNKTAIAIFFPSGTECQHISRTSLKSQTLENHYTFLGNFTQSTTSSLAPEHMKDQPQIRNLELTLDHAHIPSSVCSFIVLKILFIPLLTAMYVSLSNSSVHHREEPGTLYLQHLGLGELLIKYNMHLD